MVTGERVYKLVVIAPTCFYYQVPLFRQLAQHPRINLNVIFCSDEAVEARDVAKMYRINDPKEDGAELLLGYKYKFLRNYSPKPSYLNSFFGLMNLGIGWELKKLNPDIVVIMSWMNPTWWLAVVACTVFRIPFLYMTDANVQLEGLRSTWKIRAKRLILGKILFKLSTGFLCGGTANKLLYQYYGVPDEKLVPFAYSWGYESLLAVSEELKPQRAQIRADMAILEDSNVILYCGRLSKGKGLFELLHAYERLSSADNVLVMVGDGELRDSMQKYVTEHNLGSVLFVGFQNRQDIPKYYAMADVLILPSYRETWGIVVSEAMCFGLPIVATNQVGAALDLVKDGHNGYVVPIGDSEALANKIEELSALPKEERMTMGSRSSQLITQWVQRDLVGSLDKYLDYIYDHISK